MEKEIEGIEGKPIDRRKFNGGARPNSGTKPFVDTLANPEVKMRIAQKFLEMSERLAIPYLEGVANGTIEVDAATRFKVNQEILNRALGKPRESMELSGRDGGPIQTVTGFDYVLPEHEAKDTTNG